MKILSVVFAAIIFSFGTSEASVLIGFIRLPETATLTPEDINIYVVGREQKIAKPNGIDCSTDPGTCWFSAATDDLANNYDVVMMNGETVVATVNLNGLTGFGFLTFNRNTPDFNYFSDIVSFVPCQIYESIQMLECGK